MYNILQVFTLALSVSILNQTLGAEASKYFVSEIKLSYIQAYATCKASGWELAVEKSADDTANIENALKGLDPGATNESYYLAGMLPGQSGFETPWIWLASGQAFSTYTNWRDDDVPSDEDEPCLVKLPVHTKNGKWIGYPCSEAIRFICMKN